MCFSKVYNVTRDISVEQDTSSKSHIDHTVITDVIWWTAQLKLIIIKPILSRSHVY